MSSPAPAATAAPTPRRRLTGIDAARGIASILVMLYHANAVVQTPKYFGDPPFGAFFGSGSVRMPFFFAMSGFMLCYVHGRDLGNPARLGPYLLSRFARIYPAYWTVLLLTTPVYFLRPDFGGGAEATNLTTVLKSIALWPQPTVPFLVVAWTLQSLMLFYLVFAVAIWRRWVGALVFGLWQVAVLTAVVMGTPLRFPERFLLDGLYFSLLLGAGAAYLVQRHSVTRPALWFAAGLIYLILAAILEYAGLSPLPYRFQLLANGVAAAVLLIGLARWERERTFHIPTPLLRCGDASYSIFLIHYPLLSVLAKVGSSVGLGRWLNGEAIFLLFAAICIGAGILFHRWVEAPVTAWVQRRLGLKESRGATHPAVFGARS